MNRVATLATAGMFCFALMFAAYAQIEPGEPGLFRVIALTDLSR